MKVLCENRQARFNYHLADKFEAGMILEGWEVKSILAGRANFNGGNSFIRLKDGEAFLESMTVTPLPTSHMGHLAERNPNRSRKLLLTRSELDKLIKHVAQRGYTLVPLAVIQKRKFKLEIALAKGKNNQDKRETVKQRDLSRLQGD